MRPALVIAVFTCAALPAQQYRPGPQVATFFSDVDDTDQPYGLYVPKNYDPAKKYPLVMSLHGAGSNHRINLRRVLGKGNLPGETDAEATRYFPTLPDVDYFVASPLARGTMGYQGIPEKDVYDVLGDVKKRFSIDENRVYLTGLSMGGGGTLWLGLTRPDVWAAIAPVCAAAPAGTDELAPNALNLPVHLFHGDADTAVPVEASRRWHKELLRLGTKVVYVEYPGVRHNSWDNAYRDAGIFRWFDKFRREPHPPRVRFATRQYRYDSAYWVRIDALTPGELASIDARFSGPNQVEVETGGLDAFTLKVGGHPQFAPAKPLRVTVDGRALSLRARESASFRRGPKGWEAGLRQPPAGAKCRGQEGPIGDAVAVRHVYVYGTGGSPSGEELNRRRDEALRAAEWSQPRSRLLLSLRAISDKEVKDSDVQTANLVLFGTRETNAIIAKLAPQLPLELNAGAADYGLVFVCAANGRYVVVNSGLPWWTGAELARRPGFRFMPAAFRQLLTFSDFILFKGSLEQVVAEGRFDANWKVPPQAAGKMRASGAVEVR